MSLGNFFQKYITLLAKKASWLIDLVFLNLLTVNFQFKAKFKKKKKKKKMSTIIRNFINQKVSIRSTFILLSNKVVNTDGQKISK